MSCAAYAADFAHEVWGVNGYRYGQPFANIADPNEIRDGDIIHTDGGNDGTHYFVVLHRFPDGTLWTAEGNVYETINGEKGFWVIISRSRYTVTNVGTKGDGKTPANITEAWHNPNSSDTYIPEKDIP